MAGQENNSGRLSRNHELVRVWWGQASMTERQVYWYQVAAHIVASLFVSAFVASIATSLLAAALAGFGFSGNAIGTASACVYPVAFVASCVLFTLRLNGRTKDQSLEHFINRDVPRNKDGSYGICLNCGYDLSSGGSRICPECGARAVSHLAELRR